MPKRLCSCGGCEYCSAYTQYEMNCEYGRFDKSGKTREGRIVNFLHHQAHEEMCADLGTHGTTYESRKAKQGPLPQGTEIADSLAKKVWSW